MKQSDLSAHGYYRIELQNDIVVAELKGGWNTDIAVAFCEDFKQEAAPLCGGRWGHIVYLNDWELGVPGVDEITRQLVDWCIDNGLTHAAHVNDENTVRQQYVNTIVDRDGSLFEKRVFPNDTIALAWLNSKGYYTS